MLEEPANEVAQPDVFAEPLHAGHEAAGGADDEIDPHARLRGGVEVVDGDLVHELVHLGDDACGPAGGGVGGLVGNEFLDTRVEVERRDEQVPELGRAAEAGERVEELRDLLGDGFAGGEKTQVGIEPGGLGIVIAGAEMDVAAQALALATDDEAAFAMGFVADQAVHHMDARLLELARPVNVVGLVEPCLQLDERGDLFSVEGSIHQRAHDRGVAAGAVEGLLDGKDLRVAGGLFDEIDDGVEGIVGVVEQDLVFADMIENRASLAQGRQFGGGERRVFEIGAVGQLVKAHQPEQVEGPLQPEGVVVGEIEITAEDVEEFLGDTGFDLEPDGGAAAEIAQLLLDFFEQVVGFLVVDVEIAVARHAKRMGTVDRVAGEKRVGAKLDDFAEKNVALRALGTGLDLDDARENPRHGEDDHQLFRFGRVGIVERHEHIEGFIADLGKGMELVDRQRGEHG